MAHDDDRKNVQLAAGIADAYVAELQRAGLPTYPGWKSLPPERKIMALASVFGGGSVLGAAQAALFVLAVVHSNSELRYLADVAQKTIDVFNPTKWRL